MGYRVNLQRVSGSTPEHKTLSINTISIPHFNGSPFAMWQKTKMLQTMKTSATLQLSLVITCGSLLLSGALRAQGPNEAVIPTDASIISQELVQADYTTEATRKTVRPFTRTVKLAVDGKYMAVVTDAYGTVRMRGAFQDPDATVANGEFEYFYANGRKESKGEFVNGRKKGKWACWTSDGTPRADRFYQGMTWEELMGLSEQAATLGEGSASNVPEPQQ